MVTASTTPVNDTTPPTIDKVTIGGTLVTHGGTIVIAESPETLYVEITATDTGGSGLSEYQITATNAAPTIDGWGNANTIYHEFRHNVPIYIWVKDNAGNISAGFKGTAEKRTTLYVSSTGSDTDAGTKTAPLNTIGKAIELLPATDGNILVIDDITILSAITVNKAITLKSSGSSAVVLNRGSVDGLLKVINGGNLTIENITLDGQGGVRAGVVTIGQGVGSGDGAGKDIKITNEVTGTGNRKATAALITVDYGGNLTLKSGATLQNNKNRIGVSDSQNKRNGEGGGIYNAGTVTINGGTITGNSAVDGGGIYVANRGKVNLGAGSAINISGNINSKEMKVREDQILGIDVAEKISNGYIPYFSNNIVYTNTDSSPIKVIGNITVASGTKIGLSPSNVTANAVLVEKESGTMDASHFSVGTVSGGNLTIDQYGTGTNGPGDGKVFFCNEARYEISKELTKGGDYDVDKEYNWTDAVTAATNCSNGGKNDWFFPMIDVLAVAMSIHERSCWSSSESSIEGDKFYVKNGSSMGYDEHYMPYNVRAVRAF